MSEFTSFPKIPRLRREVIVTEKIDGTNASIWLSDVTGERSPLFTIPAEHVIATLATENGTFDVAAGSRKRFIKPGDDNFGFAKWVHDNVDALLALGEGVHHGEWWGVGIQRGYGLSERRFSLFNTHRWTDAFHLDNEARGKTLVPDCCHVVPVVAAGTMDSAPYLGMKCLRNSGSLAAPGYDNPEGVVIYHTAANQMFKMTFEMDDTGKEQG